jgi:hypothetical protein
LAARLRRSNIDASAGAVEEVARIVGQIWERWPRVRIILRADSGFARESLMTWCEHNRIDYLFGLARNQRLVDHIAIDLAPSRSPDRGPSRVGSRGLLARDGLTTTPRRPASRRDASLTSLDHQGELKPSPTGRGESRMDAGPRRQQRQSALRGDLAEGRCLAGPTSLRTALLRPRLTSAVC